MMYALDKSGQKVTAQPGARARCPHCQAEVIAKCGEIKRWHWAHKSAIDCDNWGGGETDWHLYWKSLVPSDWVEATIKKDGKHHRADILLPSGTVVELQHSSISPRMIEQRESFYGSMVWLFDISGFAPPCDGEARFMPRKKDGYHTFRWYHPRKHIAHTTKPTYLDMGHRIMHLKAMYPESPCGGWGYVKPRAKFVRWLIEQVAA